MDPETEVKAAEIVETVAEAIEEIVEETDETVTDNEVAIAEIEANKEITIAAIHADARVQEAEAYSQPAQDENKWTLELLATQMQEMQTTQALILERLSAQTFSHSEPEIVELEPETVEAIAETLEAEMVSTQQSTSQETSGTPMEAIQENVEENLAGLPPILEIGRKPIIKLV